MFAHFRPLFFIFVALLMGIYFCYVFYYVSSTLSYISLILCLAVVLLILASLFCHNDKVLNKIYNTRKALVCVVTCFMIGFATFVGMYRTYTFDYEFDSDTDYYLVGSVKSNYSYTQTEDGDEYLRFLIKDVVVMVDGQEVSLSKNVYLKITVSNFNESSDLYQLSVNDDIVLSGSFVKTPVFGDNYLYEYAYKNNFEYSMYLEEDDIILYNKEPVGLDAVREKIHDTLYKYMSPKYASLAYSVLIGDRTGLDDEIENNLKVTGVAHIVAVSGLHVGFVVTLMALVLKLCRVKKGYLKFLITTVVLIFYCVLCGMTPSVTRATIMAICLLSAKAFRKQSDGISSVSLAGIIILCMHPLYVFDVSFQLSFSAVFAIMLLVPLFSLCYKKFKKNKILNSVFDTINLSLSAQIGTMPYIMKTFNYVSTFSLLINIVIVPFFGIVYMLLFVLTILSMLLPFVGYLLYIPQICFVAIDFVTNCVASIPFATLPVKTLLPLELFVWAFSLFVISDKCILNTRTKRKLGITAVYVAVLLMILCLVL